MRAIAAHDPGGEGASSTSAFPTQRTGIVAGHLLCVPPSPKRYYLISITQLLPEGAHVHEVRAAE